MNQSLFSKIRIIEFDWLKLLALLLILLVHSDLFFIIPEIIFPVQWFLVSCFFFVSGYLAFNSFYRVGASILIFIKRKFWSLYVPFITISAFYFILQTIIGRLQINIVQLLSSVTLLNIFDVVNVVYNWDFLWFIPYLVAFMLIFCFIEKYIQNSKIQILFVILVWIYTIIAWTFDVVFKPGQVFSQYFLVFMIGVWLNKLKMYKSAMRFRTAFVMIPLILLSSINLSNLFTFNNTLETLKSLLYYNSRSIIFSISALFLVLIFLRKIRTPHNRFVELIAKTSILIYFAEPFLSYLISNYIFGKPIISFSSGLEFYLYQIIRIIILFLFLPLAVKTAKRFLNKISINERDIIDNI